MDILMSIKPKYAEAILSGKKKYEFRKTVPCSVLNAKTGELYTVFMYVTKPVGLIIGTFEICRYGISKISKNVELNNLLWAIVKEGAGITKEEFDIYFANGRGYVIQIERYCRFTQPHTLDYFGLKRPPQSWQYINKVQ